MNKIDFIGDVFLSDYGSTHDDTFAMTIESIGNIITPPLPGEEGWTSKTFAEYLQNNWTLSINRDLVSGDELVDGEWSEFSNLASYLPDDPLWGGGDTTWLYLETYLCSHQIPAAAAGTLRSNLQKNNLTNFI